MAAFEIICGKNAVMEVVRAGRRKCFEIFVAEGKREKTIAEVVTLAHKHHIPLREVSRSHIAQLAHVEKNQGIAAKVEPFSYYSLEELLLRSLKSPPGFLVLLDGILDPQNLGSLIRSAHQFGAGGIVLPKDHSAPVSPVALRASAGATEYLPIAQVVNLSSTIKILKNKDFWIYGMSADAEKSIYQEDFSRSPVAIILGSEGKGIRRLVGEGVDIFVSIPMKGKIDSLNVSAAGAVVFSEIARQREQRL